MAQERELKAQYLRKDLGHLLCVHVGAQDGVVGFSSRGEDEKPSRPGYPDFWLDHDKVVALHKLLDDVVTAHNPAERPTPPPVRASSSAFLQANVDAIVRHGVGYLRKAPWWLRWRYSGVITKDEYID